MMSQGDINTCKMNDILALLKPNVSDFERNMRNLTGYWHDSPTSREIAINAAVCSHLLDRMIERRRWSWW